MTKELKALLTSNPNYLDQAPQEVDETIHFQLTPVDGDQITIPICGYLKIKPSDPPCQARPRLNGVTCQACIDALNIFANMDSYEKALDHATKMLPKIMTPDPKKMTDRHGPNPTQEALNHIAAQNFMRSKGVKTSADLPYRLIGSKRTFYRNMTELTLVDKNGDRTGVSVADLAAGRFPEFVPNIKVDE